MRGGAGHRGLFVAGAAALAITAAMSAGATAADRAAPGTTGCANATGLATQTSPGALTAAIICLVNEERQGARLGPLKSNRQLAKAAQQHTKTMVKEDCLLHQCPGERAPGGRLAKSGYTRTATTFTYAENIGCDDSAAGVMEQWMASPLHRGNILNRRFKEIGVGSSQGQVPSRCADGHGTYTIVFGARKR